MELANLDHRSSISMLTQSQGASSPIRGAVKRGRDGDVVAPSTSIHSTSDPLLAMASAPSFSLTLDLEQLKKSQVHTLLADLESKTHFGRKELEELHDWVKKNCIGGIVDRVAFAKGLNAIGITDPLIIEQNFSAFDSDKSGTIDFREFAVGLSTLLKGSAEERMRLMFDSYDLNADGKLSQEEVYFIFRTSLRAQGGHMDETELRSLVISTIRAIDQNNDGQIDFAEFKSAVLSNKLSFLFPK
jgi:Ca2+-binding EF-hand superfamily protein